MLKTILYLVIEKWGVNLEIINEILFRKEDSEMYQIRSTQARVLKELELN